jgi:tetrahydromethanopterin S-methyltransferase subunit F
MLFRTKNAGDEPKNDWVTDATEAIEKVIDQVRDKAVVPLTTIARGIVYGLLATIVGLAALIVFAILFARLLIIYIGNIPGTPDGVWLPYLVAGAIFVVFGLFFWSRSRRHVQSSQK